MSIKHSCRRAALLAATITAVLSIAPASAQQAALSAATGP